MLANFGVRGSIWPEFHHRERGIRQAWTVAYCAVMGLLLSSPPAFSAGRVFYDGLEDGTTNAFGQAPQASCPVVTSSVDGVTGPNSGQYMLRCNWFSSGYESLHVLVPNNTNEVFYRVRLRLDNNVDITPNSGAKIMRIYHYNEPVGVFGNVVSGSPGLAHSGIIGNQHLGTYWGGNAGDNTASRSEWHTVEYYFNRSTGAMKAWHDDVLVYERTVTYPEAWVNELRLVSNFFDGHDDSNHVYFDDIEAFTEVGNTATGSMASGTVAVGSAPESLVIRVE